MELKAVRAVSPGGGGRGGDRCRPPGPPLWGLQAGARPGRPAAAVAAVDLRHVRCWLLAPTGTMLRGPPGQAGGASAARREWPAGSEGGGARHPGARRPASSAPGAPDSVLSGPAPRAATPPARCLRGGSDCARRRSRRNRAGTAATGGGGGGGGCAILAGVPAILAGGGRGPAPAWGLRGESAVSDFQAPRPRPRGGGGLGRIYVVIVKDREHPRGRSGWIDQGRDRAGPRAGPVGSSRPPIARGWRAPPRPQRARPPRVTRQHRGSGRGGRAPAPGGNRGGPPQAGPARPSRGSRTRPPGRRPRALSGVG